MTTKYRLQRIKTCANCGHHKSVHAYEGGEHKRPATCRVPGCVCKIFRQPAEGEHIPSGRMESNGPRTGILSDGTRVNVYYQEGVGDPWTIVPHSEAWDAMERRGMRSMLGMSETASGISQWSEGQEGRHLGRKVAWVEVPDNIKRHIEQRVVEEASMVANPRKRAKTLPSEDESLDEEVSEDFSGTSMAGEHSEFQAVYEHGQWFVTCLCGASWSVVDTSSGFDYERIDEGDEDYHSYENNPRGSAVDEHAARELSLYIENDYALIGAPNSRGKAIDANLLRKVDAGTYDASKAPAAWQHLIDEGAKKYTREFGTRGDVIFSAATRRKVAEEFARAWEYENKALLDDHDVLRPADPFAEHEPNARRIPEELQPYRDWSYDDFYKDLIDDGRSKRDAHLHATMATHRVGGIDYLKPRNIPKGWTLHSDPIFRRRDAKPAFEAHKGTKYMVFGLDGKPLSPELSRVRGLLEWRDEHGWVGN